MHGEVEAMNCQKKSDALDSAATLERQLTSHCSRLQLMLAQWSQQQELIIKSALEADDRGKSVLNTDDRPGKVSDLDASSLHGLVSFPVDAMPVAERPQSIVEHATGTDVQHTWLEAPSEDENEKPKPMCPKLRKTLAGDMEHIHDMKTKAEHEYKEKKKKRWLHCFVGSAYFESVGNLVIVVNALVMAVGIDYAMDHPLDPRTPLLESLELGFTVYYTTELFLKIVAEGPYFICSDDIKWNLFDTVLVLSALYEVVTNLVQPEGAGGNVSFMRIIKLAKMFKTLRVLRVLKSFRELRLIVSSMVNSLTTVFWSALLIVIIVFTTSVLFTQSIANYLAENSGTIPKDQHDAISKYWQSVLTGMTSLYMASTGGDSWSYIAEPLKPCGAVFYMLFMLYIMFFLFVIVNTLASIFIEATFMNANQDDKAMIQEEMKKKNDHIRLIKRLFHEMDVHSSGKIEKQQFMQKLKDPRMLAFFTRVGIEAVDASDFLDVVLEDDDSMIDVDKFVLGCMKLKGNARSMDLLGFIHAHDSNAQELHNTLFNLTSALVTLRAEIKHLDRINQQSNAALRQSATRLSELSHLNHGHNLTL